MGDLQPIIDAILNDARIKAAEITERAESRRNALLLEFDKEQERERDRFCKQLETEIDRIYDLEKVKDRQLVKTAQIRAKSEFVKEACAAAKKQLYELDDKEYMAVLSKLYKRCNITENGVVCLNERDKKRVKKSTFPGSEISDSEISANGGFIVVCNKISYDCTFDSLFEEKYSEICDKVNALFKEVKG